MRLQVTLTLFCLLLPEVLALKCYECVPVPPATCTDREKDCAGLCASGYTAGELAGVKHELWVKNCVSAAECVNGSLNLGTMKMSINTKCCSTNLCNSQPVPALPRGSPNGKQCYTCVKDDCTGTVNCEGDEDRCVSLTGNNSALTMKGCGSRSLCSEGFRMQTPGISGTVSCCEGNLCNSAEGVKLSLLIMVGPLLSSILFL
ncbi:urokinase plasminogen activator surface receptor-like [Salminus brasiliensis]|uniref:urokinase plasminogen activator surface receptor-like n=1 Tax=Salminus brasiliensis TaxID=930266 RepID=UPI003B834336